LTLYTIGHGTRTLEELVSVLDDARIEVLADVRRYPASRRNPQFSRTSLEHTIRGYEWWGETLGGRRKNVAETRHAELRNAAFRAYADYMDTPEFRGAFDELLACAAERRLVVMCAETPWWRCHRRLLADGAVLAGVEVVHLGMGAPQPHPPDARLYTPGV
jgi:uncharacterized protein (DUF488 family)